MDVRPGGRYRISFKTEDGEYHEVRGVYREVVPDTRLVISGPGTPLGAGGAPHRYRGQGWRRRHAHLAPRQFFDDKAGDGHKGGWTGTLARLERYLTS